MDGSFVFDVIDDDLDEDAFEGSDGVEPEEDEEAGDMHEGFTTPVDEPDGAISYVPTYTGLAIGGMLSSSWITSIANTTKAVNPFTFSDFAHLSESRCFSPCPIQCRSL